ncbi:hypothetical protein [Flammeovirga aprica]|uniref:Uncharacterized protein n=1 Tax=Flammeovirga aprica JL-4 TaxID=694437 RepID=A0A7X9XD53_9BACT|nr:hypothetical protein [Flammeovirga aprica]NME72536.1 hypothetical protein [Flammeovirga aprica JL-4]
MKNNFRKNTRKKKYTDEQILEEARKYKYLNDFRKANSNMVNLAYSRKIDLSFLKKAEKDLNTYKSITAKITQDKHAQFVKIAERKGITATDLFRMLVDDCIEREEA